MVKVKVGSRGQITIPSEIRKQTGIKEGVRLAITVQGNVLIIRPITHTLLDLRGSIKVSEAQDFSAIRKQVIASRAVRGVSNET